MKLKTIAKRLINASMYNDNIFVTTKMVIEHLYGKELTVEKLHKLSSILHSKAGIEYFAYESNGDICYLFGPFSIEILEKAVDIIKELKDTGFSLVTYKTKWAEELAMIIAAVTSSYSTSTSTDNSILIVLNMYKLVDRVAKKNPGYYYFNIDRGGV